MALARKPSPIPEAAEAGESGPTQLSLLLPGGLALNLWLVGLMVPLWLAFVGGQPGSALRLPLLLAPLAPLCLGLGLWRRAGRLGQALLLIAVPLFALVPGADTALHNPRLWPRPAVLIELILLSAYLLAVGRLLAHETSPVGLTSSPPAAAPRRFAHEPLSQVDQLPPTSPRLSRRLWTVRLLIAYVIGLPALLVYAIDFHGPHLRALRASFQSPLRQSAIQASLTALIALVLCVAFYFALAAPLLSHLSHHRELRDDLQALRRRSRRARPSLRLWLSMWLAIVGMGTLLYWALNGKWSP